MKQPHEKGESVHVVLDVARSTRMSWVRGPPYCTAAMVFLSQDAQPLALLRCILLTVALIEQACCEEKRQVMVQHSRHAQGSCQHMMWNGLCEAPVWQSNFSRHEHVWLCYCQTNSRSRTGVPRVESCRDKVPAQLHCMLNSDLIGPRSSVSHPAKL